MQISPEHDLDQGRPLNRPKVIQREYAVCSIAHNKKGQVVNRNPRTKAKGIAKPKLQLADAGYEFLSESELGAIAKLAKNPPKANDALKKLFLDFKPKICV